MKRLKFFALALVALFASVAAMASSASALVLPEILPLAAAETKWSGTSEGEPVLLSTSKAEVKCVKATATGTELAKKPEGLFHITFTGCKNPATKQACTGLSDKTEEILTLGTWHLVFDIESPTLGTAILFEIELVHFSCTALLLVEVKGTQLCLDTNPGTTTTLHLFTCLQKAGVAEEKKYFNAGDKVGTEGKVKLECSENHAAFVECAEEAKGNVKTEREVFADF